MTTRLFLTATAAAVLWAGTLSANQTSNASAADQRLAEQVRHELVLLPFYGVFDNLAFSVNDGRVRLTGDVSRPSLKKSAERVAQRVEGVTLVENEIEVLPTSRFDDLIRLGVYRAVYGHSALGRYAIQPRAPIRIIVHNGDVTLEGVVASGMDKTIAGIMASGVHGVFSVTNNLQTDLS